jgi:2-dehydro-3-deoxyphosphogluconate aldolase/(4S)-4-hydroxy-2-oxoglutarate aldolase
MNDVLANVLGMRLIPVVAIHEASLAVPLAEALEAGGLPCVEITCRTAAAFEAIRALATHGRLIVGAGTVLNVDQARQAADSGAAFIVSPGFSAATVRFCQDRGLAVLPGVCTPSEIMAALEMGLSTLKFFPAEVCGGLKALQAIGAAFPQVRFVPTGGIGPANLADYLRQPQVAACGGSWMVAAQLIAQRRFGDIVDLTRAAVAVAASVRGGPEPARHAAAD